MSLTFKRNGTGFSVRPGGTVETWAQPSLRDLESGYRDPSVETPGYSQSSLRDAVANSNK